MPEGANVTPEPLVLAGDIDVDGAEIALLDLLEQAARYGEDLPPEVEIDCSGVTFLGSAGLAMLVRFRGSIGRRIALLHVPPEVRHPLEVTGLHRIFAVR